MRMFHRFLGHDHDDPATTIAAAPPDEAASLPTAGSAAETATVRRIVARLEALPPEEARFLAAFAYVMSRAANADMDISADETQAMEGFVVEHGHLDEAQAVLVVE